MSLNFCYVVVCTHRLSIIRVWSEQRNSRLKLGVCFLSNKRVAANKLGGTKSCSSLTRFETFGRFVILGNHRDAWTFGAVDPNSGTACLLEVINYNYVHCTISPV